MNVEQQGPMECGLSTMAALAGKSLAEARQIAAKWASLRNCPFHCHRVLQDVAMVFGGPQLVEVMGFDLPTGRYDPSASTGAIKKLNPKTRKLPPVGRGVIRVYRSTKRKGHLMPWENGLIYNPHNPGHPVSLPDYRVMYLGWHVHYITVEP